MRLAGWILGVSLAVVTVPLVAATIVVTLATVTGAARPRDASRAGPGRLGAHGETAAPPSVSPPGEP